MPTKHQQQLERIRQKRLDQMRRDRARGLTLEQIAAKHGVTSASTSY